MNEYQKALDKLCDLGRKELTFREICEMEIVVETLQKLVEKATPKKAEYRYFKSQLANYYCLNCGEAQGLKVIKRWSKFCPHCGQALDWSEDDDC